MIAADFFFVTSRTLKEIHCSFTISFIGSVTYSQKMTSSYTVAGLIAQLVEHCTGIAGVIGLNLVQA